MRAWQRCTFFAGMMTNAGKRDSRYMLFSLACIPAVGASPTACIVRYWRGKDALVKDALDGSSRS